MIKLTSSTIFFYIIAVSLSYEIHTVSGLCRNLLPYSISSVAESSYLTWYGKVGDSASGTYYEPGHLFERHVAVNNQCTADQIKDGKTVFINRNEMIRTVVVLDTTNCDLGNTAEFNYRTTKTIASASEYIDGIDCQSNTRKKFNKFYIQYKKTLQNRSPSQSEYMGSQKVTVWTVYPAR